MEHTRCCSTQAAIGNLGTRQLRVQVGVKQSVPSPEPRSFHQRLGFVTLQHRLVIQQQWRGVPLQLATRVATTSAQCRHVTLSAANGMPTVVSAAGRPIASTVIAAAAVDASGSGCKTASRRSNHQVHTTREEEETPGDERELQSARSPTPSYTSSLPSASTSDASSALVRVHAGSTQLVVRERGREKQADEAVGMAGREATARRVKGGTGKHKAGGKAKEAEAVGDGVRRVGGEAVERGELSCTTFNVLCPLYKRMGRESERESSRPDLWVPRTKAILASLLEARSSIICLQECWLSSQEWTSLVVGSLKAAGYKVICLQRTNGRGDGLLVAVLRSDWSVEDCQQLLFHDCGDRVAQLVRLRQKGRKGRKKRKGKVEVNGEGEGERRGAGDALGRDGSAVVLASERSNEPSGGASGGRGGRQRLGMDEESEEKGGGHEEEGEEDERAEVIILNTHLLFPHDANSSIVRLCQVYKLLEHLESYREAHHLHHIPVLLCGDLNGTKAGNIFKLLRAYGFVSCYDQKQQLDDSDQQWVSHRNHHGVLCGVDFIWLLNPTAAVTATTTPVAAAAADVAAAPAATTSPCSSPSPSPSPSWRGIHPDWRSTVFGVIKSKLQAAGMSDAQAAFDYFRAAHCRTNGRATAVMLVERQRQQEEDEFGWMDARQLSPVAVVEAEMGEGGAPVGQMNRRGFGGESVYGATGSVPVMNEYDFEGESGEGEGGDGDYAMSVGVDVCVVDDTISLSDFRSAVVQLGLTGNDSIGLTAVEVDELMRSADRDGNGVVDFEEFEALFQQPSWEASLSHLLRSISSACAPLTALPVALPGLAEGEGGREGGSQGDGEGERESMTQHVPPLLLPLPLSQPQSPRDKGEAHPSAPSPLLDCALFLGGEEAEEEGEREEAVSDGFSAVEGMEQRMRRVCVGKVESEQGHAHAHDDVDCSEDLHMPPPLAEMACDEITRMLNHEASETDYHHFHLQQQQQQQQRQQVQGEQQGRQRSDELERAYSAITGTTVAGGGREVEKSEVQVDGGRRRVQLAVKEAWLSPGDMADGYWPDSYVLSDHAILTARLGVHMARGGGQI